MLSKASLQLHTEMNQTYMLVYWFCTLKDWFLPVTELRIKYQKWNSGLLAICFAAGERGRAKLSRRVPSSFSLCLVGTIMLQLFVAHIVMCVPLCFCRPVESTIYIDKWNLICFLLTKVMLAAESGCQLCWVFVKNTCPPSIGILQKPEGFHSWGPRKDGVSLIRWQTGSFLIVLYRS